MIWMKGWPVGVCRTSVTLVPRQKQNVMSMMNPSELLTTAVQTMARGRVCDASRSSSLMCVAASDPRRAKTGASWPTMHERATLPQGLVGLSWKVPNTSLALLRGPKTHMVMKIAKKPKMCKTRTVPSTRGSLRARRVLKMMEKLATATMKSVPCHCSGMYESLLRMMRPWICPPARKAMDAMPVCQPRTHSQPMKC
jgi:hypothetical protein